MAKQHNPKQPKKKVVRKKVSYNFPAFFTNTTLHCVGIAIFAFLLYANTLGHGYTQDDAIVLNQNTFTKDRNFAGLLKYDTFRGFYNEPCKAKLVAGGRYRPFTLMMLALEGENPILNHFVNVLLYAGLGVMLYLTLLKMLRERFDKGMTYFVALVASLIFVAHPLHVEAVANVKGRDEIVSLLSNISTLYFIFEYLKKKHINHLILATIIFFTGMMSKEMGVTMLGIVPMTLYVFSNAKQKDYIATMTPILLGFGLYMALRLWALGNEGDCPTMASTALKDLMNDPFQKVEAGRYVALGSSEKFGVIFFSLLLYIKLLFVPHPLTHDYYPRQIEIMEISEPLPLLSLILHLGLFIYAIRLVFKKDLIGYGLLFYFMALSLVSNVVFPIGTNMGERFLFMPSVGFSIVIGVLLYRLAKYFNKQKIIVDFKPFKNIFLGLGLIILLFSIKTITRNTVWESNEKLFETDIAHSPNSAKIRNSRGCDLTVLAEKEPDSLKRMAMYQEAVIHLQKAVEIHPNYKNAHLCMGNAFLGYKQFPQALAAYQNALNLDNNYIDAYPGKARTHEQYGMALGGSAKHSEARVQFQEALNAYAVYESLLVNKFPEKDFTSVFKNDKSRLNYFVGLTLAQQGDASNAINYLERALKFVEPNSPDQKRIYGNLSNLYKDIGNEAKAIEYQQKASN